MKTHREEYTLSIFILGFILVALIFAITMKALPSFADDGEHILSDIYTGQHFVTIYDHGTSEVLTLKTTAGTVTDVLDRANIHIDAADIVEPNINEVLVSENFRINIYRAKPAIVVDGLRQYKIMTAASTPEDIVLAAGIGLQDGDYVKITKLDNFIEAGLPFAYAVMRAKTIEFNFYGQTLSIRTGANTVADFLAERKISLAESDWLSQPLDTKLREGFSLELHRQGKQTVTVDEEAPFFEQITHDYSYNVGYRLVTKAGEVGQKTVTYEIEMKDGKEISRQPISEIITKEPITQHVTLGARAISMRPLTAAMGRNRYTTPTGILREETYYDLNMSGVMQIKARECGGSAYYGVRADGVKVDSEGFVIVAADLSRYPRCSIVETSLGLGKVYDTGSFAHSNPEQFDIATDWSIRDGI